MKVKYLIDPTRLQAELEAVHKRTPATDTASLGSALSEQMAAMLRHLASRTELAFEALTAEVRDYTRLRMRFCGPYAPGTSYAPNDCVQKGGALWIALIETTEPPGASSCWRQIGVCR